MNDKILENEGIYKLVIIGGGPAGIGIMIRAARTGYLPRLMNPIMYGVPSDLNLSQKMLTKQLGVALVHDGNLSSLGGGNLGEYVINSNTFAKSLLSSCLEEKPEFDPPESIKGTFLERVTTKESHDKLKEIGASPACLVDFGKFLTQIGSCLYEEFQKQSFSSTSKCLLDMRATQCQLLENGLIRIDTETKNGKKMSLLTEHLALAMGGKQELPSFENPAYSSKAFTSDLVLRREGFEQLKDHLVQIYTKEQSRKVCIVGGSHSSFSVAWLLLNKLKKGFFQPKDITILHRSPIRLYYLNKRDADMDGADSTRTDRSGCINTFTGLREDSKNLYKDIRNGKETRIRMYQVNKTSSQSLVNKAYESSAAIIWSCGYTSRMIPILDATGQNVSFQEESGVIKLDLKARLQQTKAKENYAPTKNIFGVGLGFSLRSQVDEMGTETRADGVTVYHRRGATLVLAGLYGNEVFGENSTSFEEMTEKNEKKKNELKVILAKEREKEAKAYASLLESPQTPTKSNHISVSCTNMSPLSNRPSTQMHSVKSMKKTRTFEMPTACQVIVTNPPVKALLERRRNSGSTTTATTISQSCRDMAIYRAQPSISRVKNKSLMKNTSIEPVLPVESMKVSLEVPVSNTTSTCKEEIIPSVAIATAKVHIR
jgi:hypothetical protein